MRHTRVIFHGKLLLYCCLAGHFESSFYAQTAIRGQVNDAGSGQPIEAATVLLIHDSRPDPIAYTLTGSDGTFTLPPSGVLDSLTVRVSLLGYRPQSLPVRTDRMMRFALTMDAIHLKEVEVRPGRVWGRQDTINFQVDGFRSERDRSIQDVLKKMPGIDIDEEGKIAYNGKAISQLYIEGLDLTDGKYAQLSRNLQAEAVDKVQVLENHQPIRVLRKNIKTEEVALNLQLKPDFRDRWMGSLGGSAGASPLGWSGAGDLFQISRKSQSAYLYKGNNTGLDVTEEQAVLASAGKDNQTEPEVARTAWLTQPSFDFPLKKRRLLFNNVHSLAFNRLLKTSETARMRLNAGYIHDRQRQNRGSQTIYYQQKDSLRVSEQSDNRLCLDRASLGFNLENNADRCFLTNTCYLTGDWQTGKAAIQTGQPAAAGPDGRPDSAPGLRQIRQQIRTPELVAGNSLHGLWSREGYTLEVRSRLRYYDRRDGLLLEDEPTREKAEFLLPYRSFTTANAISVLRKKGKFTGRYEAGFTAETSPVQNRYSLSLAPHYQWNTTHWNTFVSIPLVWTALANGGGSRFTPHPSLTLIWKVNYAWRLSAHARYQESYGSLARLRMTPYRTDYRHIIQNSGLLPVRQHQLYSIYGQYKNTVRELFATLNLTYTRERNNLTEEQLFEGEQQTSVDRPEARRAEGWTLKSVFSKGFYDWGLKTSLSALFYSGRDAGFSEGELLPFRNQYLELVPKISWTPCRPVEISYEATFRYGGSTIGRPDAGTATRLTPLWNIVQQGQIRYDFFPFALSLTADHYRNDVNRQQTVDTWLADVSVYWKSGSWEMSVSATNLFNRKEYRYTEYAALQEYTSWIRMRPREFLLTASFRF